MLERKALKKNEPERCILIGAITREQNEIKSQEYINELKFLAQTAGTKTIKVFQQKLDKPDPNTFLGSGKMDEVNNFIKSIISVGSFNPIISFTLLSVNSLSENVID